jgi:hypothetical protein
MSTAYVAVFIGNVYVVSNHWAIVHQSILIYDMWDTGATFTNS